MIQRDMQGRILFVHSNVKKKWYFGFVVTAWSETYRREPVVRLVPAPSNWGTTLEFDDRHCFGWTMKVKLPYKEASLIDMVGYDHEYLRFSYLADWYQRLHPTPGSGPATLVPPLNQNAAGLPRHAPTSA